jgi:hypothetical protein
MSDNPVRCTSCNKSLGGLTREGEVRLRLAITLVKSDGTVHGPCEHCGADVIVSRGGAPEKLVQKALGAAPSGSYPTSARAPRGRLVLNLRDLG